VEETVEKMSHGTTAENLYGDGANASSFQTRAAATR